MQTFYVFDGASESIEARDLSFVVRRNALNLAVMRSKPHLIGQRDC